MRGVIATVVVTSVIASLAPAAFADETSRGLADAALATCESVDVAAGGDKAARLARLEESARLGEAAVAAAADDAHAHLALFCALGKELELAGLSWRSFQRLRRARAAIERAHELAPDDADVLVAKGEMLRRLPRAVGGDGPAGLALLRRAVELAPDHLAARLHLARAAAADGAPEARSRLYEALAVAKRRGTDRERSEVESLLASLRD